MGKKHASQYANFGWLPNYAAVGAQSCGRWSSIVRSLMGNRAVVVDGLCGRFLIEDSL